MPTATFEPIATITNNGAAQMNFTNIPQTYTDLIFSCRLQWQQQSNARIIINYGVDGPTFGSDATNKSLILSLTNSPYATSANNQGNNLIGGFYWNGVWEGQGGQLFFHIFDYTNTGYYKSTLSRSSSVGNSVYSLDMIAGTYLSTSAITKVSFMRDGYNNPQYTSSITMYGITYGS